MRFGNRGPRHLAAQRRAAYRPKPEGLEERLLLAINMGGTAPPTLPNIATAAYGVGMAGASSGQGAGFSVTDLGDVNADGYDDFLIGAPSVSQSGGQITLGNGANSTAYLVFGSRSVNAGNINWLTLDKLGSRVGDLGQLGNTSQTDPINNASLAAPFSGIKFITSQNPNAALGASSASVGIVGGAPAFLIGAPGATDANGANPGTGRAYLIYGGSSLSSLAGATIDLDNTGGNQGINWTTFVNLNVGAAATGRAVAGPGDIFTDNSNDVAIGAPNATFNGNPDAGAVYLIDGAALSGLSGKVSTVNLNTVGQSGGTTGMIFTGANGSNQAGFSIAGAGDVNGALTGANERIPDLLIGAPGASTAYLIYGGSGLLNSGTVVGGINQIGLALIGNPATTTGAIAGAVIAGNTGDGTGYAVSGAGDFNVDGLNDILIGSPFANSNAGTVTMLYGAAASGTPLIGSIPLGNIPSAYDFAQFTGATGNLAGYSLSAVGRMSSNPANEILIGAPGTNNNNGTVYLIPGVAGGQSGVFPLSSVGNAPIAATVINNTTPGGTVAPFFGASVSGRITQPTQTVTVDNDLIGDFIIGAPGYSAISGRGLAGWASIGEGSFIPLGTPVSNAITTQIGVGTPFPPTAGAPFPVNATTPTTLQIYVFSNANVTPAFDPVQDINPATVVVNGVAFANATITKDPVDENKDGIEDAIITISPRSNIGLTNSTTTLTITGRTLASAPSPNTRWVGTASISVSGGGGGGGGGAVASSRPIGEISPTYFVPQFGPDQYTPGLSALSVYNYKAIPIRKAIEQFLPPRAFRQRMLNFFFPHQYHFQRRHSGTGIWTLGQSIFDGGRIHGNKPVVFTHKVPVVPTYRQTEKIWP